MKARENSCLAVHSPKSAMAGAEQGVRIQSGVSHVDGRNSVTGAVTHLSPRIYTGKKLDQELSPRNLMWNVGVSAGVFTVRPGATPVLNILDCSVLEIHRGCAIKNNITTVGTAHRTSVSYSNATLTFR